VVHAQPSHNGFPIDDGAMVGVGGDINPNGEYTMIKHITLVGP
jgi:hypothetical protein